MPLSDAERQALLEEEGIVSFDKDLRLATRDELLPAFGTASQERVKLAPLLRSIMWQAHGLILSGREPPIRGNIRTFWYRFVKPVLAHIPDDDEIKTRPYRLVSRNLTRLVKCGLVHYRDFGFDDENESERRVGEARPDLFVFSEKTGWRRFLKEVHQSLGVTTLALGGQPSLLTSEYTAFELLERGVPSVKLYGVVDYDPSGDIAAEAFAEQLQKMGLEVESLDLAVRPERFSPSELAMFAYEVARPDGERTKVWMNEGGGIGDEPLGLEAESLPYDRALEMVEAWVGRQTR